MGDRRGGGERQGWRDAEIGVTCGDGLCFSLRGREGLAGRYGKSGGRGRHGGGGPRICSTMAMVMVVVAMVAVVVVGQEQGWIPAQTDRLIFFFRFIYLFICK